MSAHGALFHTRLLHLVEIAMPPALSARLALLPLLFVVEPVRAAEQTSLSVTPVTVSYSDAVDVTATLLSNNAGVESADLQFYLRDEAGTLNADLGHGLTNANGQLTLRVPMVNGCEFLGGETLVAGPTEAPITYLLQVSFAGDTAYEAAAVTGQILLVKEQANVRIVQGTSGELGEPLNIRAVIEDPDGDAPCDRSALTGPGIASIAGHRLGFFLDYTGDQDYSDPREFLGVAVTARGDDPQSPAVAGVTADTVPQNNQPRAGTWDNAIQVQLPADDTLYLPTTARGRLVLFPAPPDPAHTSLVADPPATQAGSAIIVITATLRDRFDNALGIDADPHAVTLSIEGEARGAELVGESAERDPTAGTYKQTLQGATRKGDVTLRVSVDGSAGGTLTIPFTGLFPVGPCSCASPTVRHLPAALAVLPALVMLLRRRNGRVDRKTK